MTTAVAFAPPDSIAAGYEAAAPSWAAGPGRVYDRLADVLVAACPVALAGGRVLDLGAGTGAASRAIARAGGRPVALDAAHAMLAAGRPARGAAVPPAVQADVARLPFAPASFRGVVAAFSLNHLADPAAGLGEAARVVVPGGAVVASTYAGDDAHPARAAADQALREAGWRPPAWAADLRDRRTRTVATEAGLAGAAAAAGLDARVVRRDVEFPHLDADALVAWRLGMAPVAWFVAGLPPDRRDALRRRALALLGRPPVLVRRMLVLTAVV